MPRLTAEGSGGCRAAGYGSRRVGQSDHEAGNHRADHESEAQLGHQATQHDDLHAPSFDRAVAVTGGSDSGFGSALTFS